jgi:hypothetical protein
MPFRYMHRSWQDAQIPTRGYKFALGKSFLRWGGFAPTPATSASTSNASADETAGSVAVLPERVDDLHATVPGHRMARARSKWTGILGEDIKPVLARPRVAPVPKGAAAPEDTKDMAENVPHVRSIPRAKPMEVVEPVNAIPDVESPPKPSEVSAATLAERERREKLKAQWAAFSYPMPGQGVSTIPSTEKTTAPASTPDAVKKGTPRRTIQSAMDRSVAQTVNVRMTKREERAAKQLAREEQARARKGEEEKERKHVVQEKKKGGVMDKVYSLFGKW